MALKIPGVKVNRAEFLKKELYKNHPEEVIEQAKLSAIKAAFMVGGAVVTEDWAQSIGAHYSANGVEAVKKAQELIK